MMLPKSLILLVTLALFIILVNGKGSRGRGGSRGNSRKISGGSRSSSSRYKLPRYKPRRFDRGGFRTFATIGAAMYVSHKFVPSIGFRPYHGSMYDWRRSTTCYDCVSVNGSNPECENPSTNSTSRLSQCQTSSWKPYCSFEHGVLDNDKRFIRRSCNARRCRSCSSSVGRTCHIFQCELCNWKGCNRRTRDDVFSDRWTGCAVNATNASPIFDSSVLERKYGCGALNTRPGYAFLFILLSLSLSIC